MSLFRDSDIWTLNEASRIVDERSQDHNFDIKHAIQTSFVTKKKPSTGHQHHTEICMMMTMLTNMSLLANLVVISVKEQERQ